MNLRLIYSLFYQFYTEEIQKQMLKIMFHRSPISLLQLCLTYKYLNYMLPDADYKSVTNFN